MCGDYFPFGRGYDKLLWFMEMVFSTLLIGNHSWILNQVNHLEWDTVGLPTLVGLLLDPYWEGQEYEKESLPILMDDNTRWISNRVHDLSEMHLDYQ